MITIYLSARALAAARAVEPAVSPAAVHAAIEVAVAEELMRIAGCSRDEVRARARALLAGQDRRAA